MQTIFRPEVDYRTFAIASGEAHQAIERGVLPDLWPAFERMHEAAGMGPMSWAGKAHALAFTVSGNPATLASGDLKLDVLGKVISGITRNIGAEDRFRVWMETDHIMRGARRIYFYGIKRSIAVLSEQIAKRSADLSSAGLQRSADYAADLQRLTRDLAAELIAQGLAADVVVA